MGGKRASMFTTSKTWACRIELQRLKIQGYFFISLGGVQCFGEDCYALAFGVPGLLMVIALGKCSGAEETNNRQCLSRIKHHVSTLHKLFYSVFTPFLVSVTVGIFHKHWK